MFLTTTDPFFLNFLIPFSLARSHDESDNLQRNWESTVTKLWLEAVPFYSDFDSNEAIQE